MTRVPYKDLLNLSRKTLLEWSHDTNEDHGFGLHAPIS